MPRLLRLAAVGYVAALALLLYLEPYILYTGWWRAGRVGPLHPSDAVGVTEHHAAAADGNVIHARLYTPPGWTPARGAVLYSHGKSEVVSWAHEPAVAWRNVTGRAVLLYDYPGYGESTGTPSEAGCYAAAEAAWELLTTTIGVDGRRVILVGQSLGGAMAAELAVRHDVEGLALVNTFTNFPDMAHRTVPFMPGYWLVRHKFDTVAKLPKVSCPVHVTHAFDDFTVPYRNGERLFAAAPAGRRRFYPRPGAEHFHPRDPAYIADVVAFFARFHGE